MLIAVLSGFILAPLAPVLYPIVKDRLGWVIALLPLALFAYFANQLSTILDGETVKASYEWAPSLNINLDFKLDALSIIFSLLITGIGTLVFVYGGGYLHHDAMLGRFYSYIMVFMASMLGVVLADNILLMFVFWELTSISSFLLIGFYFDKDDSRELSKQALIVTGAAGLSLLAGLIMLGLDAGTWHFSELKPLAETLHNSELYLPILILIGIGAFAKSAQFPFHFWLPGAMAGPAPVSAYLHSATMVKAGIYLLARLHPTLGGTDEWHLLVTSVGGITMLLGGYLAWQETDVKRVLAYTTISALGIMVFLLGIGSGTAVEAALLFLVVHSLYKGCLFMVGGSIDHETGTRDLTALGGLRKSMPYTASAAVLAALSMAGIPPMIGFIGKEVIYEATQHAHDMPTALLTFVAVIGNLFNVTAATMVAYRPFFGAETHTPKHPHEAPLSMWLPPVILGVFSLVLGVFSVQLYEPLLKLATATVYGKEYEVHLGLWHGFSLTLVLSAITIGGGIGFYFLVDRLREPAQIFAVLKPISPNALYKRFIDGIVGVSNWQSKLILDSFLRQYITVIVLVLIAGLGYTFATQADFEQIRGDLADIRLYEGLVVMIIVMAAFTVVVVPSRLAAVGALGVVGYGMAMLYILFSAPDLAMTQFAIETLTVILFVLVIYRLPRYLPFSPSITRLRDAAIAIASGVLMMLLVLIITSAPLESRLSPFFAEASYEQGQGHNVVNVILVDFRGFDTMGEITVLSVAALGVFGLLSLTVNDAKNTKENDG